MLRFRPRMPSDTLPAPLDQLAIGHMIDDAMMPGQFLVAPGVDLTWVAARAETMPWEIFRGRLLEPNQTRLQQTFLSWHVMDSGEPLLSALFDIYSGCIHITRGLRLHALEPFDTGGGTIETRETIRWTRELIGTVRLTEFANIDDARDELICMLWQAVVGTSRLPLTSVEAPLPAYVLGQLHYLYRAGRGEQPTSPWEDWLTQGLRRPMAWRETVKLIEFALRQIEPADVPRLASLIQKEWPATGSLPGLLRSLFNDVSLSPYTGFVANTLAFVRALAELTMAPDLAIDFLGHLLRQLGRHLTAYDLVTFHHRGANYPDALLLDAVLKEYLRLIEASPDVFLASDPKAVLRRRALRHGCLLRRHYEGHLVPDAPTSPGENARVLPAPYERVPEEQLTQALRRRRRLFADDPLPALLTPAARLVLERSLGDLADPAERLELGLGVFIDRPLGYAKPPVEPDQTPLLAHEAYSPSIARRRLQELQRLGDELGISRRQWPGAEDVSAPPGLSQRRLADCPRPVAALTDVRRVADDFVIVRTLPGGLAELMGLFDWQPLLDRFRIGLSSVRWCANVLDDRGEPVLAVADETGQECLHVQLDVSLGYHSRAGIEFPRAGLLITEVWEDPGDGSAPQRHALAEPLRILPIL